MPSSTPMHYFDFKHYINNSQRQSDWLDNFYKLGFGELADKIFSYDDSIYLLSYIFNDVNNVLSQWIYENNYGKEENIIIVYNNKSYNTIEEIYELLCKQFNKEILPFDITFKTKDQI